MPRGSRPEFARRAATSVSEEQYRRLEAIAREEGVTVAVLVRWAVHAWLGQRQTGQPPA